jgi:hypothetical protein
MPTIDWYSLANENSSLLEALREGFQVSKDGPDKRAIIVSLRELQAKVTSLTNADQKLFRVRVKSSIARKIAIARLNHDTHEWSTKEEVKVLRRKYKLSLGDAEEESHKSGEGRIATWAASVNGR